MLMAVGIEPSTRVMTQGALCADNRGDYASPGARSSDLTISISRAVSSRS
jgi:hypothetical protein